MSRSKAAAAKTRPHRNGPTARAKGKAMQPEVVDPFKHLDDTDELDDQERAKLHAALKHSWAQAEAGQRGRSLDEILKNP